MPNDLLLNEDLDIVIEDGDFVVKESTYQHQNLLILADKGEFKNTPKTGVGARRYLESERPDALAREIRQEFIADGMQVDEITIGQDLKISVKANY